MVSRKTLYFSYMIDFIVYFDITAEPNSLLQDAMSHKWSLFFNPFLDLSSYIFMGQQFFDFCLS